MRFPFRPIVHQQKFRSRRTGEDKLVLVVWDTFDPERFRSLRPVRSFELTIEIGQYPNTCFASRVTSRFTLHDLARIP
jgi:hypothetical protein